jgi:hypothetical protein
VRFASKTSALVSDGSSMAAAHTLIWRRTATDFWDLTDLLSAPADQLVKTVIALGGQMGRCSGCHAFADGPAV